jgi:hypothetical protein
VGVAGTARVVNALMCRNAAKSSWFLEWTNLHNWFDCYGDDWNIASTTTSSKRFSGMMMLLKFASYSQAAGHSFLDSAACSKRRKAMKSLRVVERLISGNPWRRSCLKFPTLVLRAQRHNPPKIWSILGDRVPKTQKASPKNVN